jgi:hypothetical protein
MKKDKTPKGLISGELEFRLPYNKLMAKNHLMLQISSYIENVVDGGNRSEWDKLVMVFVELIEASALNIKKNKEVKNGK